VMDDDHEVEPDTLRSLYEGMLRSHSEIVGPVMMKPDRSGDLSWAMGPIGPRGQEYLDYASMVRSYGPEGLVPQIPAPFNAVLYRREVFDVLGLPDERLFIRGDEIVYGYRIEHGGVKSAVAVGARVYHPPSEQKYAVLTIGQRKLTALYTSNKLKDYCTFRNRAFYFKKYGVYKSLLLDSVRYPLFFLLVRRFDVKGCSLWLKGYLHGLTGHFGYERHFLQP
jgi:rhamnopyranosyl-N-acetylglucosaminyl-diphospho-decaprenol beta-1,3/1,4-galactofuranosyltransferase